MSPLSPDAASGGSTALLPTAAASSDRYSLVGSSPSIRRSIRRHSQLDPLPFAAQSVAIRRSIPLPFFSSSPLQLPPPPRGTGFVASVIPPRHAIATPIAAQSTAFRARVLPLRPARFLPLPFNCFELGIVVKIGYHVTLILVVLAHDSS
jgi:hypothetical protein